MGKISPVMRQFLAIACCNLLSFSLGNASGWATINYIELQKENTTFPPGRFTLDEATFVTNALIIGGLLGNYAILPISKRFGYARALCLMGVPSILSYLLIIFAQSKYHVYFSRIAAGFGGGGAMVIMSSMIADISFDSVRGSLNSIMDPAMNSGVMLSFLLGKYLNVVDQAKFLLIVPVVFVALAVFMPQTPDYWVQRNKRKHAEKSQQFYKGKDAVAHIETLLPSSAGIKENPVHIQPEKVAISDFLTREAKNAIRIAFVVLLLSFLVGVNVILNFVTAIFADTGSTFSPENSSILITAVQIVANLLMMNIVDRIDRRVLLISSAVLVSVLYVAFGVYCQFYAHRPGLEWVSPACLAAITFFGCMGAVPIPFIIAIELFPAKIRPTCLALLTTFMLISAFVLGSVFPIMQAYYGLATCLFLFGGFALMMAFYAFFYVPETRGKSPEEIVELLRS